MITSKAKINVFWNFYFAGSFGPLHSEKFQKTLILAFEANSALSRENENKIVKITHSELLLNWCFFFFLRWQVMDISRIPLWISIILHWSRHHHQDSFPMKCWHFLVALLNRTWHQQWSKHLKYWENDGVTLKQPFFFLLAERSSRPACPWPIIRAIKKLCHI